MGTYWYFECMEHDPPLQSEDISQHTEDSYFWEAVELASRRPLPEYTGRWDGWQFNRNAHLFLYLHPKCRLNLISENYERRPLDTTELELKRWQIEQLEAQAARIQAEREALQAAILI